MLNTRSDTSHSAYAVRGILKGASAKLTGKQRGPDAGDGRRVPRRHSYDVDDNRARPWSKFGDGSVAQGIAHREALIQTAKEQRRQDWKDLPNRRLREVRDLRQELAAELTRMVEASRAPIGRPATVRHEIERLDVILERAEARLTRIDLNVLEALLGKIDFATGALFPSYETIADWAVCSVNAAKESAKRLKLRGFLDWVRRSIRTANEGEFAPQREQTSNAYFFDLRRKLAPRTWQRYWQILVSKLRRLGSVPPALVNAPDGSAKAAEPANKELRETLQRMAASFDNAST